MQKTNLTHRKPNHSHSAKEATIIVMTNFKNVLTTTFMIGNPIIRQLDEARTEELGWTDKQQNSPWGYIYPGASLGV